MRSKKDLLGGLYNVYAVFDKVSKRFKKLYYNTTDEEFIRLNLPTCIIDTPLRDLEVYRIAVFNDISGELKHVSKKRVDIHCYEFPHSRLSPKGENVSLEDIEKTVNETKAEIQSQLSDSEESEENKTKEN